MRCKICPSKGRNELVLNQRILQLKYRNKRARKWLDFAIFFGFSICTNSPIKWHSRGQRFDPAYLHHNKQIRTLCRLAMGSDLLFIRNKQKKTLLIKRRLFAVD